jgi:MFS family permease
MTTNRPSDFTERVYDFITLDEDGRTCDAIPESSCKQAPRNFVFNVLNGSATKLAEQLASPGLVLPWLFATIGAPAFLAGMLVPVKEACSLLPQMAVAGKIRAYPRRKWFWVGAGSTQALLLALVIPVAVWFSPLAAGWTVIALLGLFSTASGVGSVAFKDVLGKTVPKGKRGRLLAARATVGGILTLVAGMILRLYIADTPSMVPYLVLIAGAAILWAVGALCFAAISEAPGATRGGRNAFKEVGAGLRLIREVAGFRRFVLARAFLLSIEISLPFYSLYALEKVGASIGGLGIFVIANGVSNILSSPVWGRFADRSSRWVMTISGLVAAATGLIALIIGQLPTDLQSDLVFAPVFLLIGFSQAGLRLGRKTYLVDGAPDEDRPMYVAVSNTIIGAVTLLGGGLGLIAHGFGIQSLIGLLVVLALISAGICRSLPEASDMASADPADQQRECS